MTRINSAIPVKNLTDEHLKSEHREIIRIPSVYQKSIRCGSIHCIPDTFRLGTGHVLFFLDKIEFIYDRYICVRNECWNRGIAVADYSGMFCNFLPEHVNPYAPTIKEYHLLCERIADRIQNGKLKQYHYYHTPISKPDAIKLLDQ